jgi:hypothetical protein
MDCGSRFWDIDRPTSSKRKEGKPDDRGRVSVVSFSQRRLLEKKDLDALARIIPIVDR